MHSSLRKLHRVKMAEFKIYDFKRKPMIAVTDLEGDIRRLSFKVTPRCLSGINAAKTSLCRERGRSP